MSDISKCNNSTCPLKETCWRWLAPSNTHWQAYGGFEYKDGECSHYWKVKKL